VLKRASRARDPDAFSVCDLNRHSRPSQNARLAQVRVHSVILTLKRETSARFSVSESPHGASKCCHVISPQEFPYILFTVGSLTNLVES